MIICLCCGLEGTPRKLFERLGWTIVRCPHCGVGSTVIPDGFEPESYYDEAYFQGGRWDGYVDYQRSERVIRAEARSVLSHLFKIGPRTGRLLEIGCAYGYFLAEAERYFDCVGVEIAEVAVSACRSRGFDVRSNLQEVLGGPQDPAFDVVAMLDAIEHFGDPAKTLQVIADRMNENSSLIITTGDFGSFLARTMRRRWRLMTPPQHLFFFSQRSIVTLLRRVGFAPVSILYPWKLVPVGLVAYQLGRRFGVRSSLLESLNGLGIPVNLFDTMRVIAKRTQCVSMEARAVSEMSPPIGPQVYP